MRLPPHCAAQSSNCQQRMTIPTRLLLIVLFFSLSSSIRAQQISAPSKPVITFQEISPKQSGITWVHNNAHSSERHLPETVGAGCAFFDYDNDGWMDLYLVNSGPSDFFKPTTPLRNALYRNNHDGTFTDVTDKAGVAGGTFGMGVSAADYDADGWIDLYVTSYGRNILYRNNGNATFTDVTEKSGTGVVGWSLVRSGLITTTTANWTCLFPALSTMTKR